MRESEKMARVIVFRWKIPHNFSIFFILLQLAQKTAKFDTFFLSFVAQAEAAKEILNDDDDDGREQRVSSFPEGERIDTFFMIESQLSLSVCAMLLH